MWETSYAKEPVDFRLLFLRLLKKIWLIPISFIAGAVVIGGLYWFFKLVIGDGRLYRDTTVYYCDFAEDSSGTEYQWFNHYTWETFATTDPITDEIVAAMGNTITKEEVLKYVSATIESDTRVLYTYTDTHDKNLSVTLDEAVQKAFIKFGEDHKEFNSISVIKSDDYDSLKDISHIKVNNAVILGGIIGLFAAVILGLFKEMTDTAVYIPRTLEERFKIPTLTVQSMDEFEGAANHLLDKEKKITIVTLETEENFATATVDKLASFGFDTEAIGSDSIIKDGASLNLDKQYVIAVKAATQNGKQLSRVLEQAGRLGLNVAATVLTGADLELIDKYYRK